VTARRRRTILAAALCALAWARPGVEAAPSPAPADRTARRLENRVRLWAAFADASRPLSARFELVRHTALLREPYRAAGTFEVDPVGTLRFEGDGAACATTTFAGEITVTTPSGATRRITDPSARWLSDLLHRLFLPAGKSQARLFADDRVRIPKGRGMRLEFRPPADRSLQPPIRAVTVGLDPVAGHIESLEIFESSGDRVEIRFRDVRRPAPSSPPPTP